MEHRAWGNTAGSRKCRYSLFGRSVAMSCLEDLNNFYDFYDFNGFNGFNGFNNLNDLTS